MSIKSTINKLGIKLQSWKGKTIFASWVFNFNGFNTMLYP